MRSGKLANVAVRPRRGEVDFIIIIISNILGGGGGRGGEGNLSQFGGGGGGGELAVWGGSFPCAPLLR